MKNIRLKLVNLTSIFVVAATPLMAGVLHKDDTSEYLGNVISGNSPAQDISDGLQERLRTNRPGWSVDGTNQGTTLSFSNRCGRNHVRTIHEGPRGKNGTRCAMVCVDKKGNILFEEPGESHWVDLGLFGLGGRYNSCRSRYHI